MLDTLLVLGQVPGTDFYITFPEVLLFLIVAILRWEEKRHRRQIRNYLAWLHYRAEIPSYFTYQTNQARYKELYKGAETPGD
jgi:hypothetical protein